MLETHLLYFSAKLNKFMLLQQFQMALMFMEGCELPAKRAPFEEIPSLMNSNISYRSGTFHRGQSVSSGNRLT